MLSFSNQEIDFKYSVCCVLDGNAICANFIFFCKFNAGFPGHNPSVRELIAGHSAAGFYRPVVKTLLPGIRAEIIAIIGRT